MATNGLVLISSYNHEEKLNPSLSVITAWVLSFQQLLDKDEFYI